MTTTSRSGRCSIEDLIASEATALRRSLIRQHGGGRVRREDLDDLYSQATLELLARAKRDPTLQTPEHVRNSLAQKFAARVLDEQRATAGRSPAAHARARTQPLDRVGPAAPATHRDAPAELIEQETLGELVAAVATLTNDQRLVLASQLNGEHPSACQARTGWTSEKYRKVAQRARARLRAVTRPTS